MLFRSPRTSTPATQHHQHSQNDDAQTVRKMDDLHLVDFVGLQLKCKEDVNTAYDKALHAGLGDYAKKFMIFQPGDFSFTAAKKCINK